MSAAVVASVTPSNLLKGVKGLSKNQFWQASIGNGNCPDVALSLASSCPIEVESSTNSTEPTVSKAISERRKHEMTMDLMTSESMEEKQEDEVGSACMTEEDLNSPPTFGKSISFLDWSMNGTKNMKAGDGLERMGSGISVVSGGSGSLLVDSENIVGEDSKKFVMVEQGKLPSSQYKGVVPQPNGRWGAQIYEKHQRVWLGTFNREEDAAKAYDRAALKFRGRDAMTNFVPVSETDPEAAFLREHSKGEIVDMLRKHTYEEELDQSKQMMSIIRPAKTPEGSDKPNSDPKVAGSKPAEPREHLFDKAVTPSDVGKLNRLVIPKQHAEKYFPLDVNTSGKGLLLNFEDDTQKTWRFRYSYWNSSQSYVLTKGWSRFVKEKKLVAGDIVSFQKAAQQLHISFRRRPCNPASDMPAKPSGFGLITTRSPQMNIFKSEGNMVAGYPQWMQLFWPGNSALYNNPGCAQLGSVMQPINQGSSLSKTNGHDTEIWAQSSCSSLYLNDPTVYLSSNKQAHNTNPKNSMSDDRHSSLDFVKLQGPGAGIPSKSNKVIACSENTVRLFGVNLKDQSASPLNLFPTHLYSDESSKGLNKRKASIQLLSGLFSVNTQDNSSLEECSKKQCLENVL